MTQKGEKMAIGKLARPRQVVVDRYKILDRWGITGENWVHGGNRPWPIQFGNMLVNRWSSLAYALMMNGIPQIELDCHYNPGTIHHHMLWPDNEVILPRGCRWMAKKVDVADVCYELRGHLPDISLPLPLCPRRIGEYDKSIPRYSQAHHLITAVNVAKEAQHPQELNTAIPLSLHDRMWWTRELFRKLGNTGVQFDWGSSGEYDCDA